MLKQTIWSFAIPVALFTIARLLIPWAEALPHAFAAVLHYLPYLLLVAGFILSLGFNQTRLFLALLMCGLFLAVVQGDLQKAFLFELPPAALSQQMLALMQPLLLGLLLFSRERGFLTTMGLMRLAVILGLPFLLLFLVAKNPSLPMAWVDMAVLPASISRLTPLPDLAVLVYGLILIALLLRLFFWRGGVEGAFLGLIPGSALVMHSAGSPPAIQLYACAMFGVVLWSILRSSLYMAYRDELTGLQARRALREQLIKLGRRYSIAMLDVDHFKKFNDRYGHDVGDQVLQMVGSHLARAGGGSKVYRYGGEEFTLVFSGKNSAAIIPVLERLRQAIADAEFVVRGKKRPRRKPGSGGNKARKLTAKEKKRVQITVSIGVSDSSGPVKNPDEVIKAADQALYRAKKKGRNRVSE